MDLTLLSWNVNGLRAAHRKGFVEWLQESQPDMICLQEIKAQPDQLPEPIKEIEGYHAFFHSAERKGYSGVALYSKLKPISVTNGLGDAKFDTEGRAIIAEYEEFFLIGCYFPNGKSSKERLDYKMAFYKKFLIASNDLRAKGKPVIFCGDLNTAHKPIDLARPDANKKTSGFLEIEREWIDEVVEDGFVDIFREFNTGPDCYSYWDQITKARERNVGWRIDYFFVDASLKLKVKDAFILADVLGSDHCPVGITITV
jgi:exodeoxyribonuclease-3